MEPGRTSSSKRRAYNGLETAGENRGWRRARGRKRHPPSTGGTTAGRYASVVAGAPPPNFANRTMWTRDNLDVLRGLNGKCIDLVYADPPFNSKKNYEAPIGSKAASAASRTRSP